MPKHYFEPVTYGSIDPDVTTQPGYWDRYQDVGSDDWVEGMLRSRDAADVPGRTTWGYEPEADVGYEGGYWNDPHYERTEEEQLRDRWGYGHNVPMTYSQKAPPGWDANQRSYWSDRGYYPTYAFKDFTPVAPPQQPRPEYQGEWDIEYDLGSYAPTPPERRYQGEYDFMYRPYKQRGEPLKEARERLNIGYEDFPGVWKGFDPAFRGVPDPDPWTGTDPQAYWEELARAGMEERFTGLPAYGTPAEVPQEAGMTDEQGFQAMSGGAFGEPSFNAALWNSLRDVDPYGGLYKEAQSFMTPSYNLAGTVYPGVSPQGFLESGGLSYQALEDIAQRISDFLKMGDEYVDSQEVGSLEFDIRSRIAETYNPNTAEGIAAQKDVMQMLTSQAPGGDRYGSGMRSLMGRDLNREWTDYIEKGRSPGNFFGEYLGAR